MAQQGLRRLDADMWLDRRLTRMDNYRRIAKERGLVAGVKVHLCYRLHGSREETFTLQISREILTISRVDIRNGQVFFVHAMASGQNSANLTSVIRTNRLANLIGALTIQPP